ncbi:MAG: thioredoxin family protein [Muribaculaceae bacterium]|nr:thioredoxin family protein [Muribaculaceae bacterium]
MKKVFFCLATVFLLTACAPSENKNQNQSQNDVTVTDDGNWAQQTTIMSSKPMVVDFFATWCGPCKELAPILDEVERNHQGDVIFQRIDIDQKMDLVQEFGIEGVPTLMFITPKGEYQMLVGLQDAETIEGKIAELLKRSAK